MANERALPGLGIKGYADYKSDQWHLWADENWRKLSFLTSGWVKSRTTALPGSGTAGDVYIVKSDAGANANDVAIWDGAAGSEAWVYYTPQEGWGFWVRDEDKHYVWNGTAWVVYGAGEANDPNTVLSDTTATLTAGYSHTPYDIGGGSPVASGTVTPNEANGSMQKYVNGGAHTLTPPTNSTSIHVLITNDGSAGAIDTSSFGIITGDAFTTTDTHVFGCTITKNGTFTHLHVTAGQ